MAEKRIRRGRKLKKSWTERKLREVKDRGGKRGELFINEGKVRDRVQRGDHRRKSRKKHTQGIITK